MAIQTGEPVKVEINISRALVEKLHADAAEHDAKALKNAEAAILGLQRGGAASYAIEGCPHAEALDFHRHIQAAKTLREVAAIFTSG